MVVFLKNLAPVLSFQPNTNTLKKLHSALLSKIGAMRMFPVATRSAPTHLGRLNLQSFEIETIARATYHLLSLYTADALTRALFYDIIECY